MDQIGVLTAFFALCIAFFIAAIWFLNRPSFDKCSALENEKRVTPAMTR